jgi:hypothetical protein
MSIAMRKKDLQCCGNCTFYGGRACLLGESTVCYSYSVCRDWKSDKIKLKRRKENNYREIQKILLKGK